MAAQKEVHKLSKTQPRFFYGYVIVIAAFIGMVTLNVGLGAFGLFLKPLTIEFGWTTAMASGAYSLCMLVYGVLSIAMGGLSDRFGPRLVLTISGFLSGAGLLLMSQLNALWQLYLFFGVLVAAGMSGIWIPQLSTVSRWFVKRRSLMTGVVVAGIGIGGLIEPPVISRIIKAYGWRPSLVIMGCTVFVVLVFIAQFLKRDPKQMGLLAYGEAEEARQAVTPEMQEFSLREAIHTVQFWLATATFVCLGYCGVSIMVHIVRHAMDLEISAVSAANILAINGGIAILGSYVFGGLGDKIGNKQSFSIGFLLMAAAFMGLSTSREVWLLFLFAAISGFAFGGMSSLESPLVAWLFGLRSHGLIYGVIHFGFTIGAAMGPVIMAYFFDQRGNYQIAFLTGSAVAIVGIIFSSALGPIQRHEVRA